jgi:hypothetical protein
MRAKEKAADDPPLLSTLFSEPMITQEAVDVKEKRSQ